MTKIAILGNSHAAAFAHGWREIEGERPEEVTFFTAPRDRMRTLRVQGGKLVTDDVAARRMIARSSGDRGYIDLSSFDQVWLVGLGVGIRPVMQIYRRFFTDRMTPDADRTGISHEGFVAAAKGAVQRSAMADVLALVRAVSDAPVRCMPEPMPAQSVVDDEDRGQPWRMAVERGEESQLLQIFHDSLRANGVDLPGLQMQPTATLTNDGFYSAPEFAEAPARLKDAGDGEHPTDNFHMNAKYGRTFIEALLAG
ncbi:hypothetical protein H8M03_03775 [Sphingomonas sabuli]|uniref:SGNH/GDSL hydrolase family protein n=1 Tax=Sphingomonas sabuli TaxID=2764186 RepID=A0A7G9L4B4_9SPHN|nr:hypothetical protein [Sphingomonas sabuli]QNM83463.1 hypothetical protein H8M03_03775 [Sphingomonas sabuli]